MSARTPAEAFRARGREMAKIRENRKRAIKEAERRHQHTLEANLARLKAEAAVRIAARGGRA